VWALIAFPGFHPQPTVRGVFGDPKTRIITLVHQHLAMSARIDFIRPGDGEMGELNA
jgi:hypothetical protein